MRVGEYLRSRPDYEDRLYNSGVGKTQPLMILDALGFRIEGSGNAARVSVAERTVGGAAEGEEAMDPEEYRALRARVRAAQRPLRIG